MGYGNYTGSLYNPDDSRSERKAKILAHLKTLVPAGAKVTLREGRGTGTMSLQATVSNLPFPLLDPALVGRSITESERVGSLYSESLSTLLTLLDTEASKFGYDSSDLQSDYFNCAFYFNVGPNQQEYEEEKRAVIRAASLQRAELEDVLATAIGRYNGFLRAAGKPEFSKMWQAPSIIAKEIDEATQSSFGSLIDNLQKTLAAGEDWNTEAAVTAQLALVEAKKPKKVAMVVAATPKPPTANQMKKRIEMAYYVKCGGMRVDIMDLKRIFAAGEKLFAANPGITDKALGEALNAFVQTIRKNDERLSTEEAAREHATIISASHGSTNVIPLRRIGPKKAKPSNLSPAQKAWETRRANAAKAT